MPKRYHTVYVCRRGRFGKVIIALCALAIVTFAAKTESFAGDRPARSFAQRSATDHEMFSVLGLAIRDAKIRLGETRAACDRHAVDSSRGDVKGMLGLAACFTAGSGRPKRLLRAKALFEAAAARGSAEAHLALGQFYRDGAVVSKDLKRAANYFRRAASAGLAEAMVEYGLVLRRSQPNHPAACRWFERSAHANARNGIRLLGDCFAYAIGGRLDRAYAIKLYRKAARLGDNTARLKLAGHAFMGTGSDIARWEGCEWAARSAARNNIAAMQAAAYCLNAIR